jgi:hypothetical protein
MINFVKCLKDEIIAFCCIMNTFLIFACKFLNFSCFKNQFFELNNNELLKLYFPFFIISQSFHLSFLLLFFFVALDLGGSGAFLIVLVWLIYDGG